MLNLSEQIKNIDTAMVVEAAGGVLTKRGNNLVACCPLPGHDDRSPSFVIFPNGRWWCFGENIGGDAVDFIR